MWKEKTMDRLIKALEDLVCRVSDLEKAHVQAQAQASAQGSGVKCLGCGCSPIPGGQRFCDQCQARDPGPPNKVAGEVLEAIPAPPQIVDMRGTVRHESKLTEPEVWLWAWETLVKMQEWSADEVLEGADGCLDEYRKRFDPRAFLDEVVAERRRGMEGETAP